MKKPLDGKVALVAGATRGAGRGIAVQLGEAGRRVARLSRAWTLTRPRGATPSRELVVSRGDSAVDLQVIDQGQEFEA